MRITFLLACCCCLLNLSSAKAQTPVAITGKWFGIYTSYIGEKGRLIVELEKEGTGYTGRMQNPDADAAAVTFDYVIYRQDTLLLRNDDIRFSYTGVWDEASRQFKGYFTWNGDRSTFNLTRNTISRDSLCHRPQEPKAPFPYHTEQIKFTNPRGPVTLAGTFSRPANAGRFPVVILISGSGPQNRDDEMACHKPFLYLADYFARNGIATLRYDDRGVNASGGDYSQSDIYDFANDVRAAMAYLKTRKDVDSTRIGLLGHSEGAAVAQIVAAGDPRVAFLISMAGPGLPGRELIDQQVILSGRVAGEPDSTIRQQLDAFRPYFDLLEKETDMSVLKLKATAILQERYQNAPPAVKAHETESDFVNTILQANLAPEVLSVLRYKPLNYLRRIKCPVMAINGASDVQLDAASNLEAIQRSLRENGNMLVTARSFAGLNHLFQRCQSCTVAEYGELEQTMDPMVPEFITHWILQLSPISG